MGDSFTLQASKTGEYSLEIVTEMELEPAELARVVSMLLALKERLAVLSRLACVLDQPPPSPSYNYEMELTDGRRWRQVIQFNGPPSDPEMTFEVDNAWRLSEFMYHRDIRLLCVELIEKYEMEKLEVTFA